MTSKHFIFIIIAAMLVNCGSKSVHLEEDLTPNFNKAMKFFDKGKYARAKDEFDYIIMTDPGSKLANESQHYKAEALFQMKEYDEAWITFDHYTRSANDFAKIVRQKLLDFQ